MVECGEVYDRKELSGLQDLPNERCPLLYQVTVPGPKKCYLFIATQLTSIATYASKVPDGCRKTRPVVGQYKMFHVE